MKKSIVTFDCYSHSSDCWVYPELRQRYREGQEDQLGALGLVVNAIILWNTIYMDAALARLRTDGVDVRDEDVARLSPLGHEHINMLISVADGEALHVLDGLLYHGANIDIAVHHTDGGGVSDHVFALTHLLGFRFAPRIPNIHDRRL